MSLPKTVHCRRCGAKCQTGTPEKARAIRRSAGEGFCPNCMITFFLLSIEPIRDIIEGTPARGSLVPARPGKGPEILLAAHIRQGWAHLLSHTQLRPDEINWVEVVGNWYLPWPKGHEPQRGANF